MLDQVLPDLCLLSLSKVNPGSGLTWTPAPSCPFHCCRRLEERARELKIGDLPGFFASRLFSDAGFALDQVSGVIVYDG
jgi:hypothetical protein